MKKAILMLLAVIIVLLSVGCGSGIDASSKAQSIGKQALEAVDGYLDGDSEYSDVEDKLDKCYDALEYTDDMPTGEKDADWYIRLDISNINAYLGSDHYKGDSETYDELIESRNSLAEDLGESKR